MLKSLQNANRTTLTVVGIILALILFLGVNMISALAFRSERLDLTEDKRYTVTAATERVLAEIDEPITLRLYQTAQLMEVYDNLRVYSDRVTEILRTYEQLSNGKLRVERINPVPFSNDEDRALSYGLTGVNLERTGERGYFGLVGTNSVDQLETVPIFDPGRERFLEYDLTRIVYRLSRASEPKVAVIDGLDIFGDAQRQRYPLAITELLGKDYELERLDQNVTAIPGDADALVVIHPAMITDSARYAVDQYVLSGRPALIFIDPLAEFSGRSQTNPALPQFPATDLKPMTDAWGIELVPAKVVGDASMALSVSAGAGGQRVMSDYPPWLRITAANFNTEDAITGQLQLMRMSSAGALRPLDGATTTFTTLIRSTANSMLYDQNVVLQRPDPRTLLRDFRPAGEAYTLAARVTGPARSAFPMGPPPRDPPAAGEEAPPPVPGPHIAQSGVPINVIVVADVDMLIDSHVVNDNGQPNSNNSDFVVNALDNLTGGEELVGLRGRGVILRPFTVVDDLEQSAQTRLRDSEAQLVAKLEETRRLLTEQQRPGQTAEGNLAAIATAQRETIAGYQREEIQTQQQLRAVRLELRSEIDALENRLRLANIGLIPTLLILIGIGVAIWRRVRLARYLRQRAA